MAKRKRKRSNNEGSIFQRENGTWRAQVTIDGQRLNFSNKSQKACREWVREMLNQIDDGLTYQNSQKTLDDFFGDWLTSISSTVRPATLTQYQQISRDYIVPAFGAMKVRDIRPDQIQGLYSKQITSGLGEQSVRLIHAVLHRALNQAVRLGILTRNPASVVDPPKLHRKEMKFYDQTQVQQLLITIQANDNRYLALFKLAITTGMRQGELLGLNWTDLNWQKHTLQVHRQLKRKKGGGFQFLPPKTKASNRTIVLSKGTLRILRDHGEILNQERFLKGGRWKENDLIFPSSIGTPLLPSKLLKRFKRLAKQAGLPEIRFHDLRHTAASLMLNNGVPVIVVSRRLGHAQPSITLDVYGHIIPMMQEEAAEIMDELTTPIELKISI